MTRYGYTHWSRVVIDSKNCLLKSKIEELDLQRKAWNLFFNAKHGDFLQPFTEKLAKKFMKLAEKRQFLNTSELMKMQLFGNLLNYTNIVKKNQEELDNRFIIDVADCRLSNYNYE